MERVTTYMDSSDLAVVAGDDLHGVPGKVMQPASEPAGDWPG